MSRLFRCFRFAVVAAFAIATLSPLSMAETSSPAAQFIVKFRPDAGVLRMQAASARARAPGMTDIAEMRAAELGARIGMPLLAGRSLGEHTQVVRVEGPSAAGALAALRNHPDIEYAVVDERRFVQALPSDPLLLRGPSVAGASGGPDVGQWYLRAPAGEAVSAINVASAWEATRGSPGIVVAVLDTGVRAEHPDLAGRLLPGYSMIANVLVSNDGASRHADASDPGDWVTTAEAGDSTGPFRGCAAQDSSWHGTKTASVIGAAADNGVGMVGVAPGVGLLPVRVIGKCGGFDSDIIAGMLWAVGLPISGVPDNPNPARVLNLSLGASGVCTLPYLEAISKLQALPVPPVIVAAAGNSAGLAVGAPANCPGVIAVGGLRHAGTKVGYSDLGLEIAISAPGGNCVNSGKGQPCLYPIIAAGDSGKTRPAGPVYTDAFNYSVGTSFAAPMVSGTVALMLSLDSSLTPDRVRVILQQTARPFPDPASSPGVPLCRTPGVAQQLECSCSTSTCGAGMLDSAAAVGRAAMPLALAAVTQANCVLDWAEAKYPGHFSPAWGGGSQTSTPYLYRCYSGTGNCLAISFADRHLWAAGPGFGAGLVDAGPLDAYATAAGCARLSVQ